MKRPRTARKELRSQGIVILGHWKRHKALAEELGVPVPTKGQLVAVRVVEATPKRQSDGRSAVVIEGRNWVKAKKGEADEPGPGKY